MSLLSTIMRPYKGLGGQIKTAATGIAKGAGSVVKETGEAGALVQKGLGKAFQKATGSKALGDQGGVFNSGSTANAALQGRLKASNAGEQAAKTVTQLAASGAGGLAKGLAKGGINMFRAATPKMTTFAERFAGIPSAADRVGIPGAGTNYTIKPPASAERGLPVSNPVPPKSGQYLPGDTAGEVKGASTLDLRGMSQKPAGTTLDMRAGAKSTPTTKLEVKTTAARTKGDIDTRISPTSKGTIKTKTPTPETPNGTVKTGIPWTKIGLGIGGAGLGYNAYDAMTGGGEQGAPGANQSMMPADALAQASQTGQDNAAVGGEFDPNVVFDAGGPAVQSGTQYGTGGSVNSMSPLATLASGGAAGGYGAAPVSAINSAMRGGPGGATTGDGMGTEEEEDQNKEKWRARYQQKALERANREKLAQEERVYQSRFGPSQEERQLAQQEQNLAKKIAALTADKNIATGNIEDSPISASAREGRAQKLDRDSQRSLGPLMDSLALIQQARQNASAMRDKNLQAQTAYQESLTGDAQGFTLGENQTRYQLNPETGEYEQVGVGTSVAEDKVLSPTEAKALGVPYGTTQSQAYGRSVTGETEDRVLTPSEAASLGVPYGTRQSEAYGMSPDTEKMLTPAEAAALGVPYGTTQSGAYGQNPVKMSGDAAKVSAIAQTMIPEINALKARFTADYKGALRGYLMGTDRELVKLVDQVADKVGRLRSGGAVNRDEEDRFKRQIASFMDLPFGNSQQAISALDGLINEAQQVGTSINPYAQQGGQQSYGGGGGAWDW
jgi:hypothetical protein